MCNVWLQKGHRAVALLYVASFLLTVTLSVAVVEPSHAATWATKFPRPTPSPWAVPLPAVPGEQSAANRTVAPRYPRPRPRPDNLMIPDVSSTRTEVVDNLPFEPPLPALQHLQNGLQKLCRRGAQVPVEILHLGDSHTAGDVFSGYLRDRFQREFGAGGRGMLPAGVPFKWYQPQQLKVSRAKQGNWKHQNSFKRKHQGPFGVTGFRAIGNQSNQRVVLSATKRRPFEMFKLEVRTLAGGGGLNVKVGDAPVARLSTRRGANKSATSKNLLHWIEPLRDSGGKVLPYAEHTFFYRKGTKRVEVWPVGDGPVELLSWSVRRGRPGVLYHSQGVVGATAEIIRRWEPQLVEAELKQMRPDLILLAYGTNEGFKDGLRVSRY
jgi:hypothetical protein